MSKRICIIKCEHCGKIIPSPIQYKSARAIFKSNLVGGSVTCHECGSPTICHTQNIYFRDRHGKLHYGDPANARLQ